MLKKLVLILVLAALSVGICASAGAEAATAAIPFDVEIKEKMFIAQSNDIYLNPDEYIGKTIKYEGMFMSSIMEAPDGQPYIYVVRYGPGCCGDDGQAGFEVRWAEPGHELPADNDWVEVIGVLEWYEEFGSRYLRLDLKSMTVMETRGAELVLQ